MTTDDYRVKMRLRDSGIPRAFARIRLEGFDAQPGQQTAVEAARETLDSTTPTLTLTGDVGRGKTTIAAALATEMNIVRYAVKWTSAPGLVAKLDRGFDSPERAQALELLDGTAGLVIDDLDKVRATEHVAQLLFAAIDSRIANHWPLIVTTNLMPSQIAGKFPEPHGSAIGSRLAGGLVVRVTGADIRLEEAS